MLQNFRRVHRICQCPVKALLLPDLQFIHSMFQCTSVASVIKGKTVEFLYIIISHRTRELIQHSIKFHISLKFHHILISPGKEIPVRSAPLQKFPCSLLKRDSIQQILIIYMDHFMNTVMDPVINLWPDQSVEAVCDFFSAVYFYCSDLYDLEGQFIIAGLFPLRILVPFQIKDNIIHESVPSC